MNSFADEAVGSSRDNRSVSDSPDDSVEEPEYLGHLDLGPTTCRASSCGLEIPSTNASVKRKFSASSEILTSYERPPITTVQPSDKADIKFFKMDAEDVDCDRNDNELEPKTAEELAEQADQDVEECPSSCSDDGSNEEVQNLEEPSEDSDRDDRRSSIVSSSSLSSMSSGSSSGSDMLIAEDLSHDELSDAVSEYNNNNNHSGNEITLTNDSLDERDSSDEEEVAPLQQLPRVLKKTLPKQNFTIVKEVINRQFHDNFKRKRKMRFENKIYGSCRMVQRLELFKKLDKHRGCVNSIYFNDTGEVLVSASDDRHVCLWDWANFKSLHYFDSGHTANVFQAKFLPCTNDTHLITCGADSQIRMSLLDKSGFISSNLIVNHEKAVHKIALQRQMPNTFLSAGEDGVVFSIDIRESNHFAHKLLKVVKEHSISNGPVHLYSIDCNPMKNHEFIVCGYDRDIRLYDQRRISPDNFKPVKTYRVTAPRYPPIISHDDILLSPLPYIEKSPGSVTSAVFNYNGTEILASYNGSNIHLFDSDTGEEVHRYDGHRNYTSVKGVNFFGPRSEYIVSGSDCGYIYIWDKNSEAIVQWKKGDKHIVNCLEPHPSFPVLATSGIERKVKIWMPLGKGDADIRKSRDFYKVTKKNKGFSLFPNNSTLWNQSPFFLNLRRPLEVGSLTDSSSPGSSSDSSPRAQIRVLRASSVHLGRVLSRRYHPESSLTENQNYESSDSSSDSISEI